MKMSLDFDFFSVRSYLLVLIIFHISFFSFISTTAMTIYCRAGGAEIQFLYHSVSTLFFSVIEKLRVASF